MGPTASSMRRSVLSALFAGLAGLSIMSDTAFADSTSPRVVMELFTSQGCSSCPPADRLVEELSRNGDVLAMSLPVDYWDYLGWKDTLAKPEYSQRQRAYAAQRGDRSVYTPQIVVNGLEHVVGSNHPSVQDAMERGAPLGVAVELKRNDMGIEARVSGDLPRKAKMATVVFISMSAREEVAIGRGENTGATITYANVVKKMQPIGMWSGGVETFRMPKSEMQRSGAEKCAILIQLEDESGPGQIIGAAAMDWSASR
ncbi:DUF1223 domain-containing protein [Roseibium sp.]|uniref:DUF1223 domain-containing protein n=1 Tax=Roseibium sp. TaxID=1936156 RepID=UPI003A97F0C8